MDRRAFVKNTTLITGAFSLNPGSVLQHSSRNKLPKWKGFNLLDFFSPNPGRQENGTTEDHIKWMRDWGFDFVRLPIAYPIYLKFDRSRNITPDEVYHIDEQQLEKIDRLVHLVQKHGIHVSLNLHRAPGYCINAGFHEPFNLWTDETAQKAFYYHWGFWAKRYKSVSPKLVSFDLLNEPSMREDMNDQHSRSSAVPGEVYRKVAKEAAEVIHKENRHHLVIADGNNVGNSVINEIVDL